MNWQFLPRFVVNSDQISASSKSPWELMVGRRSFPVWSRADENKLPITMGLVMHHSRMVLVDLTALVLSHPVDWWFHSLIYMQYACMHNLTIPLLFSYKILTHSMIWFINPIIPDCLFVLPPPAKHFKTTIFNQKNGRKDHKGYPQNISIPHTIRMVYLPTFGCF